MAKGDPIHRPRLECLIEDGGSERGRSTGTGADQDVRRSGLRIKSIDAAHESSIVGEIEIVHAMADTGLGRPVVLALEGSGGMDQRIIAAVTQHAVEIALPVEGRARSTQFARQAIDLRSIAGCNRQLDCRIARQQTTKPAAEDASATQDQHMQGLAPAHASAADPGTR